MNDLNTVGVPIYKIMGKESPKSMIIAGLNQRLKTQCETFACIDAVLRARKLRVMDVASMPELDTYIYDFEGHKGRQMVCSVLAFGLLKACMGGDSWYKIKEAEQTPADVYQMQVYDSTLFNMTNCPNGLVTQTGGTTCQIAGDYTLELNEYNSIALYDSMNEHCGSQWPDYRRCLDPPHCHC